MNTSFKTSAGTADLIEVTGLCVPGNVTQVISDTPYWKQMHISESLQIPAEKPDAEQINSVDVSVTILRAEVIKTPRSYDGENAAQPSLEGRLLSGRKLIIEGQLCQKVIYTALEDSQPVHSAHFYVPFSSYIVVPRTIVFPREGGEDEVDSFDVLFDVNACVEDVAACLTGRRSLLKQVTLLLYAVPTRAAC